MNATIFVWQACVAPWIVGKSFAENERKPNDKLLLLERVQAIIHQRSVNMVESFVEAKKEGFALIVCID